MTIAIIDYGMGNLRSVQKAFEHLGFEAAVTRSPHEILSASKIVLPGVGAFRDCMKSLEELDLISPVLRSIQSGKLFLGICLGMQLLFTESEEFGRHAGLNLIPGKVLRFQPNSPALKVPHMGWNQIQAKKETPLFAHLPLTPSVYFVHSYYVVPENREVIATTTEYGVSFTSSLQKENLFATQFHPEKSQTVGLQILKNFAGLRD